MAEGVGKNGFWNAEGFDRKATDRAGKRGSRGGIVAGYVVELK
jgi:hypothetical protein